MTLSFHAIIGSWKLLISAMEHVPKVYWKHKIVSRSIKAKSANISVLKVGQHFVCNIAKICFKSQYTQLQIPEQHLEVEEMLAQSTFGAEGQTLVLPHI